MVLRPIIPTSFGRNSWIRPLTRCSETKDVTFAENIPSLRGIVHIMPGLNGDHWFAPDQLQVPPSEPVVDSTSVSHSTDLEHCNYESNP